MKPLREKSILASSATIGAAVGFFVLHPYTMMVYYLHERHDMAEQGAQATGLAGGMTAAFRPDMLEMGIPYALLGMIAGLFFGFWVISERSRDDAIRRAVARDTMHELMITLSHYLLNASTVIGGYSARLKAKAEDPQLMKELEIINEEARCIEAVVHSLQSIDTVQAESYTNGSETKIIDIQNELRDRIEKSHRRIATVKGDQ